MKSIIIFLLLVLSINASSQITRFIRTDTIKGDETLTFTTGQLKPANGFVGLEAAYTEITGSSSDDYMIAQASQSGNANGFATLTIVENNVYASVNDTIFLDTTDVGLWGVTGLPYDYFQIKVVGVAGDTGIVSVYYVGKKY